MENILRFAIAVIRVKQRSVVDMIRTIPEIIDERGIRIRMLLMGGGFFSADIINHCISGNIMFIKHAPKFEKTYGNTGARQGSSMTEQWKSATGNCAFGRIVKGTAYPAMAMLKLPVYKTAGRIGRECGVAPKAAGGEAECVPEA